MSYSSPINLPLFDSEHLRRMIRIATVPYLPRPACCLPSVMSFSVILLHATPFSVSSVHLSPGSHLGFLVSISRAFLSHVLSSQPCVLHFLQHGRVTLIVSPCVCVCRCSVFGGALVCLRDVLVDLLFITHTQDIFEVTEHGDDAVLLTLSSSVPSRVVGLDLSPSKWSESPQVVCGDNTRMWSSSG